MSGVRESGKETRQRCDTEEGLVTREEESRRGGEKQREREAGN